MTKLSYSCEAARRGSLNMGGGAKVAVDSDTKVTDSTLTGLMDALVTKTGQ